MKKVGMEEVHFGLNDFRSSKLGNVVDYIFVKGLSYKKTFVWNNKKTSDHNAMGLTLFVKSLTP